MANKRTLKKEINAIFVDLVGECLLTRDFVPGVDAAKANAILEQLLALRSEFICRVGACGGKEPHVVKAYYKKLRADFNARVDEILSEFEQLTPNA